MLCALTVRKLKPGKLEEFKRAFFPITEDAPPGWTRFYAVQSTEDENEVITFGFFDGTLEELRAGQGSGDYDERRKAAEELVDSVGADAVYEVIEERAMG